MNRLKKLLWRKKVNTSSEDHAEIKEGKDYIPLCSRLFLQHIFGGSLKIDSNDSSLSNIDRAVMPRIMASAIVGQSIPCDEECPGYTPIPVEPFPQPGTPNIIRCQRFVPQKILDHVNHDWERLREEFIEGHEAYKDGTLDDLLEQKERS